MVTKKEILKIEKRISDFNQKDNHMEIFEKSSFSEKDQIEYGINWGALGTQSVKNTELFIKDLQKAIKIVKVSSTKFSIQDKYRLIYKS